MFRTNKYKPYISSPLAISMDTSGITQNIIEESSPSNTLRPKD